MLDQEQIDFDRHLIPGNVKTFMKNAGATARDNWYLPVDQLRVIPGFNVRTRRPAHEAHVRSLANSILAEGFYPHKPLAAIIAKEDGLDVGYVIDGHCRLEAVKIAIAEGAEIEKIPVAMVAPGQNMEDLTVAMVRTAEGMRLSPLEIAVVCKRLVRFGWDTKKICDKLDITSTYLEGLLLLLSAPPEMIHMVEADEVAASTAIEMLRKHDSQALAKLKNGLAAARAKGSNRVTGKHLPGAAFRKVFKRHSTGLFVVARDIRNDPGYTAISPENREKLNAILQKLEAAEGVEEVVSNELAKRVDQAAKERRKDAGNTVLGTSNSTGSASTEPSSETACEPS